MMLGFGDKYWEKKIYMDCEFFCRDNEIKFSIDPSINDEGACGMFLYRSKDSVQELRELCSSYNESLKVLKALDPEKYENEDYKDSEYDTRLVIKLDEKKISRYMTFLHEIGHFILYRDDREQIERHADHYRTQYFKDKPKWFAWQFRDVLDIYTGVKPYTVYKYLGLKVSLGAWYDLQNWYYKRLHKLGKYEFLRWY
jgi:hypothetical protein